MKTAPLKVMPTVTCSLGSANFPATIPRRVSRSCTFQQVGKSWEFTAISLLTNRGARHEAARIAWPERHYALAALNSYDAAGQVIGLAFQINLGEDLLARLSEMDAVGAANDLQIWANVRLIACVRFASSFSHLGHTVCSATCV
jgi:hypothetical protein